MKITPRYSLSHGIKWYREINGKQYMFEAYHHGTGHTELIANRQGDDKKYVQVHRLYFK